MHASVEAGGQGLLNAQVAGSHVNGGLVLSGAFETRRDDGFADNDDFEQQSANVALRSTSAARTRRAS